MHQDSLNFYILDIELYGGSAPESCFQKVYRQYRMKLLF